VSRSWFQSDESPSDVVLHRKKIALADCVFGNLRERSVLELTSEELVGEHIPKLIRRRGVFAVSIFSIEGCSRSEEQGHLASFDLFFKKCGEVHGVRLYRDALASWRVATRHS